MGRDYPLGLGGLTALQAAKPVTALKTRFVAQATATDATVASTGRPA